MVTPERKKQVEIQYSRLWHRVIIRSAELTTTLDTLGAAPWIERKLYYDHVSGMSGVAQLVGE
jgi:hypothetical protein